LLNLCFIVSKLLSKSPPIRFILFKKHILGTWYLLACLHTVSDWGSTPFLPSKTTTAPSSTLKDLSTSAVKSTWPGVSIILILYLFPSKSQKHVTAADWIVIPLSLSCSIKSVVVAPSSTSPILWICPVKYKSLSVVVVFPASIWAIIPIFLICSRGIFTS